MLAQDQTRGSTLIHMKVKRYKTLEAHGPVTGGRDLGPDHRLETNLVEVCEDASAIVATKDVDGVLVLETQRLRPWGRWCSTTDHPFPFHCLQFQTEEVVEEGEVALSAELAAKGEDLKGRYGLLLDQVTTG